VVVLAQTEALVVLVLAELVRAGQATQAVLQEQEILAVAVAVLLVVVVEVGLLAVMVAQVLFYFVTQPHTQ
jgi:hypothetical protein